MILHSNIQFNLSSPHLSNTIVPFINLFGQLWVGQLHPHVFIKRFIDRKNALIHALTDINNYKKNKNNFLYHSIQLDLLQASAEIQDWNFPCLLNLRSGQLHWTTGNQRLVVTGINKKNPWQHLNMLMLADSDPSNWLNNPIQIKNDSQLKEVLNFNGPVQFDTELCQDQDQIKLQLSYLGENRLQSETKHNTITKFIAWQQRYGTRPILEIYTDWPELITDNNNAWTVQIVDNSTAIQQGIFRPGHLENNLKKDHDRGILASAGNHKLYVVKPRPIDVGELLCWMNLEKNIFIDRYWQFLLHRPDVMYNNTFISISDLEHV
jgi:hypothetical protein